MPKHAHRKTINRIITLQTDPDTAQPVRDALREVVIELENYDGVDHYADARTVRRSLELSLPEAEAKGLRYSDGGISACGVGDAAESKAVN
jgi:hypothetical protein